MDLVIIKGDPDNEIKRSVELTNENWAVLAMCIEAYADTYRTKHSQTVATYVTRGQLDNAVAEANRMNQLLQSLDIIQAQLL
jgi:hypothetical protein